MIAIEKNVKIPLYGTSGLRKSFCKYPFRDMEVGDSFFVPVEQGKNPMRVSNNVIGSARSYCRSKAHKTKPKFMVNRDGDGYRCWRLR